jgi:AhpD family alkylhydroperoxidase
MLAASASMTIELDHCGERNMERLDYRKIAPEAFGILGQLSDYGRGCGLDPALVELVKLRASQINGCANCVQLHAGSLRKLGESETRLQLVVVWREAPCFSAQERAALDWAEAVTLVADSQVPDAVFAAARAHFTDKELVDLTFAIVTINAHNRLAVAFRRVPQS